VKCNNESGLPDESGSQSPDKAEPLALSPEVVARYKLTSADGTPYKVGHCDLSLLRSSAALKAMLEIWNSVPTLWIGSIPAKYDTS
jgi:hypothetical protein